MKISHRVLRGGSWLNFPANVRAAYRLHFTPSNRRYSIGFRFSL